MFCSNCGNKIDKDSLFCSNCGMQVNNQGNDSNKSNTTEFIIDKPSASINFNKHFSFFTNSIRYPISTIKDSGIVIPVKISSIYLILAIVLTPLINVLSLKVIISRFIDTFIKFSSQFSGFISYNEQNYINMQFNSIINNYISYDKIYNSSFIFYLSFYLTVALVVFLLYKLSKIDFNLDKFFKVLTITMLVNFIFSSLAFIVSPISIVLFSIVNICSLIIVIILLFNGFKDCCNNINVFSYCLCLTISLSYICSTYMCFNYIIRNLLSSLMMFS